MNCDAQTLVTAASCLEQYIPPGFQNAVIIYLLCQIVNNGGGGGGGGANFLSGTGSPAGTASATVIGQIYWDMTNPVSPELWVATATGTGSWTEVLS